MIVWPAELPQKSMTDAFNESLGDGRLRTPMEAGPPKVRRRFSSAPRTVQVKFFLTLNEKARLARFWTEDTKGGTLPFRLPDQSQDGARLTNNAGLRITNNAGVGMRFSLGWLVMFGDQPPAFVTPSYGELWMASFPISVMP